MEKQAFTIRLSDETGNSIGKLSSLLGVTKNKLISSILEESNQDMAKMIGYLESLKIPLNEPSSRLRSDLKHVIINAANAEKEKIDKHNNSMNHPTLKDVLNNVPKVEKKEVPTYFSQFLEK